MESTGIYRKSVYAHLENAGITAWAVNAHFIKHVPGRKTDMFDSEWLAVLARFSLVRASFTAPKDLRELRRVSRYQRKLSDIHGVSARAMVPGLIEGQPQGSAAGLRTRRIDQPTGWLTPMWRLSVGTDSPVLAWLVG